MNIEAVLEKHNMWLRCEAVGERADLSEANLSRAVGGELPLARTRILPDEGSVVGWKKCLHGVIVKILVPEGVPRSHSFGRKCRAERIKVLDVIGGDVGVSKHDGITVYRKGEDVVSVGWSDDWTLECAGGIHFFITRAEAEAY